MTRAAEEQSVAEPPRPLVRLDGVSKTFAGAVVALDDVALDIDANAFFTLLGPSGCGKTTLLRMLAGFETPDAGRIAIDGRDVAGEPPNRRPVNIVFQSYALFPHMSVARNIGFGLERLRLAREIIDARVAEMLALVELTPLADRKPAHLSGGQQQRVALARALAPRPKLLLLDEPLSALDLKLRRAMQIELKRIQRESGITFLLVTHDQEEALSLSDRIAVMNAGRIEQVGTPIEIFRAPTSRFVADFMGSNILPGPLVGLASSFAAIRPEHVELAQDGIAGRLVETTYRGTSIACLVALDDGPIVKLECADITDMAAGMRVFCRFPAAALTGLER